MLVLLGSALAGLLLGVADDRFPLSPTAKLVASLALGAALVYLLSRSATRVLPPPLVVLAVIWFAVVVHAVNILDNMDGLAAGVAPSPRAARLLCSSRAAQTRRRA